MHGPEIAAGRQAQKRHREEERLEREVVTTFVLSLRMKVFCRARIQAYRKEPGPCVLNRHKRSRMGEKKLDKSGSGIKFIRRYQECHGQ